jgi:23S rRNA (uracil1939-C5)-methyltransferase
MNLRMPLTIDRLGQRGEGVSRTDEGVVFTPYALPGETILAEVDGERGTLVEVVKPSPDRIPSFCPHFTVCGGCAVQTLAPAPYGAWKRGLLIAALDHAGLAAEVGPMIDAHGEGRRRVTFHARFDRDALGRVQTVVGFMRARSHEIAPLEACPILAPGLAQALPAARAVAQMLNQLGKPLDIVITASLEGLDVDVRCTGKLSFEIEQALIGLAAKLDLARISNHGDILIERRPPLIPMGRARVAPPPGGFLQATDLGEETLARLVVEGVGSARKVLDLFSGVGTFALRLAEKATVLAVEAEAPALVSLEKAAHFTQGLRGLTTERRDLFRRPLLRHELAAFDAVVFDPPRSGAEEQAREIAASGLKTAVAVSCNVQTFARDAKILVDGGFRIEKITPVDQFRHSAPIEVVGLFKREPVKTKRRGRLLG